MLAAVKGIVQGNTVIIEDDDIREYDGAEVVVTLLDYPRKKTKKAAVDWDSFTVPSERVKDVDGYMKEMRENDRFYFSQGELVIRDMEEKDARPITDAEIEQGWDAEIGKYLRRLKDQRAGKAISLVAEYSGRPVGYINVYPDSQWGAFAGKGWPEIVDFGVLEKYRNRGVGTALMDVAEAVAAKYADIVYLGAGLHSGYGSAQRMYVKRGYIPDGSGVWYQDKVCEAYGECRNDDDLVLYFSKNLK